MPTTAVAPAALGVEVGTFFYSSWGYDQTNVDFYKVVALTPKGVKVQKWSSAVVSGHGGPSEGVVPGSGPVQGAPVRTHRLQEGYQGRGAITINSYASAYAWDGTAKSQTGSHYGR